MSVMAVPPPPPVPWPFPAPGPAGFAPADVAGLPADGNRYELVDGTLVVSRPGGLAVEDLDGIPGGDGNRYELVDGMLVVSPAPGVAHQVVADEIMVRLRAACPPHLWVLSSSPEIRTGQHGSVIPDVVVLRRADVTRALDRPFAGVPLLSVEVVSPSTRTIDRMVKRAVYARLGVASYWLVDPSPRTGPAVTVLRLDPAAGGYREERTAGPGGTLTVTEPFPVTIPVAALHGG
jgi:Uma2 family endonuclease